MHHSDYEAKNAQMGLAVGGQIRSIDQEIKLTPRDNITGKIAALKAELQRLEDSLKNLEPTGLLDLPIRQIREAMNY